MLASFISSSIGNHAAVSGLQMASSERALTVPNELGLHLRAAARLARAAAQFDSDISVTHGDKTVDAKSTIGLMTLGVGRDNIVHVAARGPDADAAIDAIV